MLAVKPLCTKEKFPFRQAVSLRSTDAGVKPFATLKTAVGHGSTTAWFVTVEQQFTLHSGSSKARSYNPCAPV